MSTTVLENKENLLTGDYNGVKQFILEKGKNFPKLNMEKFAEEVALILKEKGPISKEKMRNEIVLRGLANIDIDEPEWTNFCAQVQLEGYYEQAAQNRGYESNKKYGSFLDLIKILTEKGIYRTMFLDAYAEEEIAELGEVIDASKDNLFTYIGLLTLADRYLATDFEKHTYELPQERFMIIAMTLMIQEPSHRRMALVKEAYWALSNLYMTVATPTLSNAGKTHGQLSSCFIDVVEDSLDGIYGNNHDVARLSKNGGGLGVYLGKIRSRGAAIKGFKGISAGVIAWMKQLNTTAVNVDQLGQRQGAIAVYLDIWHKDIFTLLEARLNNGDERLRTHDLFTGVCIPDLFMETVEQRGEWHLFDPHEVEKVMGYCLEDFYDENEEFDVNGNRIISGTFREKYQECVNNPNLSRTTVPAIEIFKSIMISQLETGTPYMFYRDEVNRQNPNSHNGGMIYCSNLCTEIAQNGSPTSIVEEITKDGMIIISKKPGDFVVCNLSSINLGRAVPDNVLERLIPIQVRMLDNVIELNDIPVLQAKLTNEKYRAIGLGTFGFHHLLAKNKIYWESEEALKFVQDVYEQVAYLTIKSSMELSKEKGHYPNFPDSDWHTGAYFDKKGYAELNGNYDWNELKEEVMKNGIRNANLMCVAPNSSTSIIAGSTASIDPIFNLKYSEEKKNYKIPVTVPELNHETYEYYKKTAYMLDQHWSIKQNSVRQRFIDQAISFNLYVANDIRAKELLDLHMTAWKEKLKTTYYVRSQSGDDIDDCENCHS